MKAIIAVARGGPRDEHRDRMWAYVKRRWGRLGVPIFEGIPTAELYDGGVDEPYNRSQALNNAVSDASAQRPDWDVVFAVDADTVVPPAQAGFAAQLAVESHRAALAYREYVPLTREATARLLSGSTAPPTLADVKDPPGVTRANVSGCIVVPRFLWDRIGGFDERFVGWGGEDVAFAAACRVLCGSIERVDGRVFHLWHPVGATTAGARFAANKALEAEYLAATTVEAMADLVDEARSARTPPGGDGERVVPSAT